MLSDTDIVFFFFLLFCFWFPFSFLSTRSCFETSGSNDESSNVDDRVGFVVLNLISVPSNTLSIAFDSLLFFRNSFVAISERLPLLSFFSSDSVEKYSFVKFWGIFSLTSSFFIWMLRRF